jgi:hypothetical protein
MVRPWSVDDSCHWKLLSRSLAIVCSVRAMVAGQYRLLASHAEIGNYRQLCNLVDWRRSGNECFWASDQP